MAGRVKVLPFSPHALVINSRNDQSFFSNRKSAQLMHPQAVPIARCPSQTFLVGRHELAVHRLDDALGIDVNERAVQTVTTPVSCALDAADDHSDLMLDRGITEQLQMSRFDLHGLMQIVGMDLFLNRRIKAGAIGTLDPKRVSRQQRLAERDQLAAFVCNQLYTSRDLCQRLLAIQPNGCNLCDADLDDLWNVQGSQ